VLQWTAENASSLTTKYGNVGKPTIGTIQRALFDPGAAGGERFFGEPALDLKDMIFARPPRARLRQRAGGRQADGEPKLYSTFLLWLLSELFQVMPEVGDVDKPKFVFFSTRRICCSTTPPRRCSTRSSRWCG